MIKVFTGLGNVKYRTKGQITEQELVMGQIQHKYTLVEIIRKGEVRICIIRIVGTNELMFCYKNLAKN